MKFRTDFITNSSSSLFIIAMDDEELTEELKERFMDVLEWKLTGSKFPVTGKTRMEIWDSINKIKKGWGFSEKTWRKITDAVLKGKTIRIGRIDEDDVHDAEFIYQEVWDNMKGVDGFELIES